MSQAPFSQGLDIKDIQRRDFKNMTTISASLVKELRETTGAGMMDCKKALTETQGNLEAAVDWLRAKGLSSAAKKTGRVAAEGLVGVVSFGTKGAVVEINSETDFVGRNEKFQAFVTDVCQMMAEGSGSFDDLLQSNHKAGHSVATEAMNLVAVIGENLSPRRGERLSVSQGVVTSYVHSAVAPNLGRIGVLVALESAAKSDDLQAFGKQLAMHIAASAPVALTAEEVPSTLVDRERAILKEKALESGKPAEFVDKMVEGGLRKYFQESVLLEQVFVMDGKAKVSEIVTQKSKELGSPITIKGFVRYALGEGIEKEVTDFAQEVAAQVGR